MKIKWTKIFDWTIVDVQEPRPVYHQYNDMGQILTGYAVDVTYLHHGMESLMFGVDTGKFNLASPEYALRRARGYYDHAREHIAARKQRTHTK